MTDLFMQRVTHNNNRNIRANVSHAINAIDKLSEEALFGLTLIYAFQNIYPCNGSIVNGIDELNNNFLILIGDKELPDDFNLHWLYELEILNLVHFRAGTAGTDFFSGLPQMLPGYVATGITIESSMSAEFNDKLANVSLPFYGTFVKHEFCSHHYRIPITYYGDIDRLEIENQRLNVEQKKVVRAIFDSYTDDSDPVVY